MFKLKIITAVLAALTSAACSAPAQPTAALTPAITIVPVVATPLATDTPTLVPTLAASPTAFVTAPAPGGAAIVPILMYHHIQDLPSDASELRQTWTVAPHNFDAQMATELLRVEMIPVVPDLSDY